MPKENPDMLLEYKKKLEVDMKAEFERETQVKLEEQRVALLK